jgi:hypothetical protein
MSRAEGIVPEPPPTSTIGAAWSSETPVDPYAAVAEYPVLEPLLALCERTDTGWRFRHRRDAAGEIAAIQGVRVVAGSHLDVVRIYSHDRVVVARAWLVGERAGEFLLNAVGPPEKVIPLLVSLPDREA